MAPPELWSQKEADPKPKPFLLLLCLSLTVSIRSHWLRKKKQEEPAGCCVTYFRKVPSLETKYIGPRHTLPPPDNHKTAPELRASQLCTQSARQRQQTANIQHNKFGGRGGRKIRFCTWTMWFLKVAAKWKRSCWPTAASSGLFGNTENLIRFLGLVFQESIVCYLCHTGILMYDSWEHLCRWLPCVLVSYLNWYLWILHRDGLTDLFFSALLKGRKGSLCKTIKS